MPALCSVIQTSRRRFHFCYFISGDNMLFNPESVSCFRFISHRYDASEQCLYLEYGFDQTHHFCEEIRFPGARCLNPAEALAFHKVCQHLHLVAGISYYKAALPRNIQIETAAIDANTAQFLETLYLHGLGEFAYRNGLDLQDRLHFPAESVQEAMPPAIRLPSHTVVPIGGGKDSVVSLDILRAAGQIPSLFSVGKAPTIAAVVERAGLPYIQVSRRLSALLFELNEQGAWNGHVPISAIIAYILAAAAILYGFDHAVLSNERSANVGNLQQNGLDINHQYSKSLNFERDVQAQFARILPGFHYFSLLRPLSELSIAKLFSRSRDYHDIFCSCNSNFRIHQARRGWCLDCPKCRFVFLALAPFVPKAEMLAIFGRNLLDDASQQAGFDALLGVNAHKPFECVGEVEESAAAFYLLSQQAEWQQDTLVKSFVERVLPQIADPEALVQECLTASPEHAVPEPFLGYLQQYASM